MKRAFTRSGFRITLRGVVFAFVHPSVSAGRGFLDAQKRLQEAADVHADWMQAQARAVAILLGWTWDADGPLGPLDACSAAAPALDARDATADLVRWADALLAEFDAAGLSLADLQVLGMQVVQALAGIPDLREASAAANFSAASKA